MTPEGPQPEWAAAPAGDQGQPAPWVRPARSSPKVPAALSAASVPTAGSVRAAPSVRSGPKVAPAPSVRPGTSKRPAPSPTRSGRPQAARSRSSQGKAAVQKRAQRRTKVPSKFRDSLKRFFFSPTGMLKILRMSLIIGAAVCFIVAKAHESFIAITVQETCIVLFFILIYMVTLQHLLICLHWPLLDLINSFISAVFLLVVAILTIQEKKRRNLFYVGGILCLLAAVLCFFDALVVTKKMRNAVKKAVGIQSQHSPAAELPRRRR